MEATKTGDKVKIHYTGRLEDGTVFDSSKERDPIEFTAGGGEVIPGVSHAVIGMEPGQSKTVEVAAEDAYGPRQPDLAQSVPRNMLPQNVKVGDPLHAKVGEEERTIVVWITEMAEDSAILDANHPLAGHTLTFDIELLSVGA